RWWNPAIEDQAINRAHRLGQKSTVFVHRFVSQGTIEERIADVLEKKRQLFRELISQNGPPPSLGLSEDDIFGLFDIKARPKGAAGTRRGGGGLSPPLSFRGTRGRPPPARRSGNTATNHWERSRVPSARRRPRP